MQKTKLTFKEHHEFGAALLRIQNELQQIDLRIQNAYPFSSKACRRSGPIIGRLSDLRSELEEQMLRDCPSETAGPDFSQVYYGNRRDLT